jgi:hypothetical protein
LSKSSPQRHLRQSTKTRQHREHPVTPLMGVAKSTPTPAQTSNPLSQRQHKSQICQQSYHLLRFGQILCFCSLYQFTRPTGAITRTTVSSPDPPGEPGHGAPPSPASPRPQSLCIGVSDRLHWPTPRLAIVKSLTMKASIQILGTDIPVPQPRQQHPRVPS